MFLFSIRPAAACALILAVQAVAAQAQTIQVRDDRQRTVALDAPATRIVSLAPHLTELVFTAGAGDRLVGISAHCDYPPQTASLPRVADFQSFNYELITSLSPDLVLVWGAGLKQTSLARLIALYRAVYVSQPVAFDDIAENLKDIGQLAGTAQETAHVAEDFRQRVQQLTARDRPARRVAYLLWANPPMTVNATNWISQAIEACGGVNVFAESPVEIALLSREMVLTVDAQLVIQSIAADFDAKIVEKLFGQALPTAYIEPDLLQRPSLRLLDGAEQLCRLLDAPAQ